MVVFTYAKANQSERGRGIHRRTLREESPPPVVSNQSSHVPDYGMASPNYRVDHFRLLHLERLC